MLTRLKDRSPAASFGSLILLAAVGGLASLVGAPAPNVAVAAGGVHFDPDSPAGQEYALPLERAREEASGAPLGDESGGEGAALFGAGISNGGPGGAERGSGQGAREGHRESNQDLPGGQAQGDRNRSGSSGGSPATKASFADAGGFPVATGVALVAALLLLSGIVGLALRRLPPSAAH
jgi:hypothetical protein